MKHKCVRLCAIAAILLAPPALAQTHIYSNLHPTTRISTIKNTTGA